MAAMMLRALCTTFLFILCATLDQGLARNGLRSRSFKGVSGVQEIECSGSELDAGTAVGLLSTILYTAKDGRVVASANFATKSCLTTNTFSSCVIDGSDSRRTGVKALVLDLKEEESREYGCNVTAFSSVGKAVAFSWIISVSRPKADEKSPGLLCGAGITVF